MPLRLVVGPPNSGRAGRLLEGFRDSLGRDPVLVVPTADDVERFERELAESEKAVLGGSVLTFAGLVRELARDHEISEGRSPGVPALARIAREEIDGMIESAELPVTEKSASRPGFAPALVRTFDELEATVVLPEDFSQAVEESESATAAEREIALIYERWSKARSKRLGRDEHGTFRAVRAALRSEEVESPWADRPVFLYGFDDFSGEQLELVASLAEATTVTVSVTFDEARPALEARARMLTQLAESVPEDIVEREDLPSSRDSESKPLLDHLARNFLGGSSERKEVKSDSGLRFLASAGTRSEAELVGTEVARLMGSGVEADQIAIVLRNPGRNGIEWKETLEGMGLPVALEASLPVLDTNTGRAIHLLGLIAAGDAEPSSLIEYLRIPGRAFGRDVDRLEREVIREPITQLEAAIEVWHEIAPDARATRDIERLRGAETPEDLLAEAANLATAISQDPVRGQKVIATGRQALELRAGGEISRSLDEVAAISPVGLRASDLGELLQSVNVRTHRGPAHGLVRIASPYRFRAQRVQHLFVASLQDDEFPSRSAPAQLLSDALRLEVGLPDRSEPIVEERYLFSACLSRPTDGLWLSWRRSDAEGKETSPSPFFEDIRDIVEPVRTEADREKGQDPLFDRIGTRRGLDEVVIDLDAAISDSELLRNIASRGRADAPPILDRIQLDTDRKQRLEPHIEMAVRVTDERVLAPHDLLNPEILERVGNRGAYGVTTLENYLECPYRWFVGHELKPDEFKRKDGATSMGTVAHIVLQRLFGMEPGGPLRVIDPETKRAVPGHSVPEWIEAVDPLIDQVLAEEELAGGDFERDAKVLAMRRDLKAFVVEESKRSSTFLPDPEFLEIEFGNEESADSAPALELDGLSVKGKIDRVDVDRGGGETSGDGIVVDYKYSASGRHKTTAKNLLAESKLQAQLYAIALERCFGIDAAGSYYLALGIRPGEDGNPYRPRGVFRREIEQSFVEGESGLKEVFYTEDALPHKGKPPTFTEIVDEAKEKTEAIARNIREGIVERDPNQGECPSFCGWQGICRLETRFGDQGE